MRFLGLICLLFLTSCSCLFWRCRNVDFDDLGPVNSDVNTDEIIYNINAFDVEFNVDRVHNINLDYATIIYDSDYIYKIRLDFSSQDHLDIHAARRVIVDVVEGYMEKLNSDPLVIWSACNGRLTPFNFDINITLESFGGQYIDILYVNTITLQDGMVYYYAYDAYDPRTDVWHQLVEPYYKTTIINAARLTSEHVTWEMKHCGQRSKDPFYEVMTNRSTFTDIHQLQSVPRTPPPPPANRPLPTGPAPVSLPPIRTLPPFSSPDGQRYGG